MADPLTTESLSSAAAEKLTWLGDHGFRHFKSQPHFRRKNKNGFSYITISSTTSDRVAYQLAFYLGVQITEVESWILNLMGNTRKVSLNDQTVSSYTVNVGPTSPHWHYPVCGTWTLTTMKQFHNLTPEIGGFVQELALPFVNEHQDPLALRRTLMEAPGRASNIWPYRPILAIDCLYGSPDQTEADIVLLDRRYERYAPRPRQEFNEFVSAVRRAMNQ